jgi:hypothetical protein
MNQLAKICNFPEISNALGDKSTLARRLQLRPFGCSLNDLEVNFDEDPPVLVTKLIRLCTVVDGGNLPDENFYFGLEVGKRIECLIRITMSETLPNLITVLKCLEHNCGKYLELTLKLDNILSDNISNGDEFSHIFTIYDKTIRLRKPTGFDQLSWLSLDFTNQTEAIRSMVATLLENSAKEEIKDDFKTWSNDVIEYIAKAMSKMDPLIDYKIELKCPLCGFKNLYRLDLEKLLLKRLKQIQFDLLNTIHQLASYYHWTENDIIAMPESRRRLYLSQITGEK